MSSEQQMSESQGNQRNNSRRLGRGLDALLGTGGKKEVSEPEIGVDADEEKLMLDRWGEVVGGVEQLVLVARRWCW